MRRLMLAMFAVCAALFFGGCADPVVMSEVLQQRQDQKIYTRYNLWYLNPAEISSLNIQQGTFLPLGSEIEPVGTSYSYITGRSKLTFRDLSGREYTIDFDPGYRLCSLRDFIAQTFTTELPEEQTKDIPAATLERIRAGQGRRRDEPARGHARLRAAACRAHAESAQRNLDLLDQSDRNGSGHLPRRYRPQRSEHQ